MSVDLSTADREAFEGWVIFHQLHENGLSLQFSVLEDAGVLSSTVTESGITTSEEGKWFDSPTGPTQDLDDAIVYFTGGVRWDGCINWSSDDQYSVHACSKEEAMKVGALLGKLYDLAEAKIGEKWLR